MKELFSDTAQNTEQLQNGARNKVWSLQHAERSIPDGNLRCIFPCAAVSGYSRLA